MPINLQNLSNNKMNQMIKKNKLYRISEILYKSKS